MAFRFTKENIDKVLKLNEGFTDRTSYTSRNSSYENYYKIEEGKLTRRSVGKTSWADSRYDETETCDTETTRRFLRERKNLLKLPE